MRVIAASLVVLVGCGGEAGSSCPAYMRIVDGEFSRTATRLTWTMEVEDLPATLTFDRADVPAHIAEYEWAIELDVDGDTTTDLQLSISHFRRMDVPETITNDILAVTQEGLWTIEGASAVRSGSIDASLAGTTFTFAVDETEDAGLGLVTETGQATWTTFHRYGPSFQDQCDDSFRP